jgi:hypothetical protein
VSAFIDMHRDQLGVEPGSSPACQVVVIAFMGSGEEWNRN